MSSNSFHGNVITSSAIADFLYTAIIVVQSYVSVMLCDGEKGHFSEKVLLKLTVGYSVLKLLAVCGSINKVVTVILAFFLNG